MPINMFSATRPGSNMPSALSFVGGAPPKRKADDATSSNDINDNNTAKRQRTAPNQPNLRQRAKNPKAAKRPRRPRPSSAATANNTVAINTAPAPAPAATSAPTSSASSYALAAVQDQPSQPTTASTQSASKVRGPKKPLQPPTYRSDACFTQAVPAPSTEWDKSFPAPTPRLFHPLASCPVDWTKLPHVEAKDIEAYELRAPWNPREVPFQVVANRSTFPGNEGKQPSMEGIRKRFKNANAAIFALTGVYFQES